MQLLQSITPSVRGNFRQCRADCVPKTYVYFPRMGFTEKLSIGNMRGRLSYNMKAPLTELDLKLLPYTRRFGILDRVLSPLYAYYKITGRAVNYDS